jgi:hypothetical protein
MIQQLTYNIMILNSDSIINNDRDENENIASCNTCDNKPADIFQVEGDYCLDCWQKRTYPNL